MPKPQFHFKSQGSFIDGQFQQPQDSSGEWVSRSPGDFSDEIGRFQYAYSSVDRATRSAREAFAKWRKVPASERAVLLKKYQDALRKHEDELVETIAREVGKPVWESR